jgi:hypothetical protein
MPKKKCGNTAPDKFALPPCEIWIDCLYPGLSWHAIHTSHGGAQICPGSVPALLLRNPALELANTPLTSSLHLVIGRRGGLDDITMPPLLPIARWRLEVSGVSVAVDVIVFVEWL